MGEKIQSRPFVYGDKCESEWPPKYGTRDAGNFYWDKETHTFIKGYPPNPNPKLADAPTIITDTIDPYYHPGACQWTDSKSAIKQMDDACGTITTDKKIPPDPSRFNENKRRRREDLSKCLRRAVTDIDNNMSPLTEYERKQCERKNELVSSALGIDAFNACGRKKDERGKRYRRK